MLVTCVYLYCDGNFKGCDCEETDHIDGRIMGYNEYMCGDSHFETKKDYKAYVISQGWQFRGLKAFCSNCKKH